MTAAKKASHPAVVRHLRMRPRLWSSVAVGVVTGLLMPADWVGNAVTRGLIGWNTGVLLYLGLTFAMMRGSTAAAIRSHAKNQDEGQYTILMLVSIAAVAVLVAIAAQLASAKDAHGALKAAHVGLALLTVITAWLFTQTIFAVHYAHEFHARSAAAAPAFLFPGPDEPDYFDFLYVACIIGTSGQTADVSFASSRIRRVGLMHCVLAFFFNTTLLALTINVAASLI